MHIILGVGGGDLARVFRRAGLWGSELYSAGVSWLVACRLMRAYVCTPIWAYSANKSALTNTHKQISSSGEKQRVKRECRFHREGGSRGCVYFWGVFASTCARVEQGERGGGASRSPSLILCGESPHWAQLPILSTVTVPFSSLAPETIRPCLPVHLHTKSPVMRQTLGVN